MNEQEFLAHCRRKLADTVNAMSTPPTIDVIVAMSLALDRALPSQMQQRFLEYPAFFVENAVGIPQDRQIEVSGRRFEITICDISRGVTG
jgi:hypothetical protein